jgi:hypothetical protein
MRTRGRDVTSLTRRALSGVARITLGIALFVLAAGVFRFTFLQPTPVTFHNYGVVRTSIGVADVACGGDADERCAVGTTIRFASCSPQFHAYFDGSTATGDRLVRTLIGKRPPSGNLWVVECGGADAMIQGQPLARLTSN